jgi:NADH dehydrogenase
MATIGRGAAVADLPLKVRLTGFLGWLAWLGLHLLRLVGVRNRISVFLNWAWSYVTWDRGPRLILVPSPEESARLIDPPRGRRSGGPTTPR